MKIRRAFDENYLESRSNDDKGKSLSLNTYFDEIGLFAEESIKIFKDSNDEFDDVCFFKRYR